MPTTKPRIAVTLDHESYEIIARFASLQGKTKSKVCAELLQGVTPFMRTPIALLEKSQRAPEDFQNQVVDLFAELESDILGVMEKRLQSDLFGKNH